MKGYYVIAEIGVNFYDTAKSLNLSPLDAAKMYIFKAKESGADAVKFQSYKADTIVSKNSPAYWDLEKESTPTQHALFLKHDGFNKADYQTLCDYANEVGVDFMSTPFDFESADYLDEMIDIYKISSSDLTNIPFIRHIAKKGKTIYLSTGASYISEIDNAVRAIKEEGCQDLCVMHCVLSYPTKNEDANLDMIKHLKQIFPDVAIGYSDHTLPDENMTILAAAYMNGATIIEKHFTLDKSLTGNDHYHSMDEKDLAAAIKNLDLIDIVRGSDKKTVLDCELTPRKEARRSLVLTRDLKAGQSITENDIMLKRPGTGISPEHIDVVIGRTAKQDLTEDTVLTWDMI
ncbi:N-acetylneuraminate synthase family protein [Vibrio genomosp. F10]|uniref:N-acetylneuraminate synthase family protein n=1 Tax=Vibrio genomosp. F10 TaxID=723171 RepID=UPI0003176373|nr:N-acetylneuraminate synthase family protein [Vibrio genomosp. F10]OEF04567.1 acetylneuraminic acid synthetase [Vibrio genomosp. F10 str. 9ZB36]